MVASTKICVIGLWHLGSVYSVCMADFGYSVVGWDPSPNVVSQLNKSIAPIVEPGLNEMIHKNIEAKRLSYTTDLSSALKNTSYVFITFDTPINEADEIDFSPILNIAKELPKYLENGAVIIISSQMPIGTCEHIQSLIAQQKPALKFGIAYFPENLRLGHSIKYFKNPDRIVMGANETETLDKAEALFSVTKSPIVRMNLRTAEMTKHALNAFLATSISFANEIANLCDLLGADALEVAQGLSSDERIGQKMPLMPGLAFSGGTLARDLNVMRNLGDKIGYDTSLLDAVMKINSEQNKIVLNKLERIYKSVKGLKVGILGLTYKPVTSTLRRSAALDIIKGLTNSGAEIKAYDPQADPNEVSKHKEFVFCKSPYEVADGSDAIVLVTDWAEFRELDFAKIKSMMKKPVFIDARNMLDSQKLIKMGFIYSGIGRGQIL